MGVNREKAIADVGKVIEAPQMARAWKDFGSVGAPASVRYAVDQRECVLDLRAALTELKDATLSLLAWKPVRDMDEVIARVERALEAQ